MRKNVAWWVLVLTLLQIVGKEKFIYSYKDRRQGVKISIKMRQFLEWNIISQKN
jgi:hypothetical protein